MSINRFDTEIFSLTMLSDYNRIAIELNKEIGLYFLDEEYDHDLKK